MNFKLLSTESKKLAPTVFERHHSPLSTRSRIAESSQPTVVNDDHTEFVCVSFTDATTEGVTLDVQTSDLGRFTPAVSPSSVSELSVIKSVIGDDDERTKIDRPESWPHSPIGLLRGDIKNPFDADAPYLAFGTGVMVGPHHVLTAAHVVTDQYDQDHYWIPTITFFTGKKGTEVAHTAKVTKLFVPKKFKEAEIARDLDQTRRLDYAILILDSDIGNETGWMGLMDAEPDKLKDKPVSVIGYPVDKNPHQDVFSEVPSAEHNAKVESGFQMWTDTDAISSTEDGFLFYSVDTYGGQSGSAVSIEEDDQPYVVGVHGYGVSESPPDYTHNSGVRITKARFNSIVSVISRY